MDKSRLREVHKLLASSTGADSNSNVIIIDGLNTFMRIFGAVPALNDDGDHVGGVVGFLRSIGSNIRQFQATRCIVVFDGKGGSVRRRKIYPDYKGNRINKTKLNRHEEFEGLVDEAESMKRQFHRLVEYMDALPITLISIDNIEADDTIAYIAKQYYEFKPQEQVTIVSTDRDFLQLVNNNIRVWSPIKKKLYTPEVLEKELGIKAENYLLYRMFLGDPSDNIPGINSVGLKTLKSRFPEICERKVSAEEILKEARTRINEDKKPLKVWTEIANNEPNLRRNYALMQLHDVDIPGHDKLTITAILDRPMQKLNINVFKKLFLEDKLYTSIKDMYSWLRETFYKLNIHAR